MSHTRCDVARYTAFEVLVPHTCLHMQRMNFRQCAALPIDIVRVSSRGLLGTRFVVRVAAPPHKADRLGCPARTCDGSREVNFEATAAPRGRPWVAWPLPFRVRGGCVAMMRAPLLCAVREGLRMRHKGEANEHHVHKWGNDGHKPGKKEINHVLLSKRRHPPLCVTSKRVAPASSVYCDPSMCSSAVHLL
jgi:hypothetical protein